AQEELRIVRHLERLVVGEAEGVLGAQGVDQRRLGRDLGVVERALVDPGRDHAFEAAGEAVLGLAEDRRLVLVLRLGHQGLDAGVIGGVDLLLVIGHAATRNPLPPAKPTLPWTSPCRFEESSKRWAPEERAS